MNSSVNEAFGKFAEAFADFAPIVQNVARSMAKVISSLYRLVRKILIDFIESIVSNGDKKNYAEYKRVQHIRERITDKLERGLITAAQANVELVRAERFRIITNRLMKDVRRALDEAVKAGTLGYKKKEGLKPAVYFHPTFEYLANQERNRIERESIARLSKVFSPAQSLPHCES